MTHPAFTSESVAVITGGASGIGLAAAKHFATMGMRIAIGDKAADRLDSAANEVRLAGATDVVTAEVDVSSREQLTEFELQVSKHFGGANILMNNAGVGMRSSTLEIDETWEATLGVNLWGPINGTQIFAPNMIARGKPGAIINTGSKQGITSPPGNPAYNVSKAAVKTFTEALAHELRESVNDRITAHLLIPGFVHTRMTGAGEKPPGAWTAEQTVSFFIDSINNGDFYILCPDNDVNRELDQKRIAWAAGDLIENRPALSRWHADYKDRYADYIDGNN